MRLVSVIIPVYNVEKYLKKCLDSIINQTYKCLQIIIIDDGSTDLSGHICDEYAKKDNRITVIHQNNAGAANAKNTGLDNIKGDYLTFVDSDDWVELKWIEKMVNAMDRYDVDVVECGFDNVFMNVVEKGKEYKDGEILTTEEYFRQYNDNWVSVIFWNKMFKANLTNSIRFRKERRCIDDEFYTYKVVSNGEKMVRISDILYHYRQRKSSAAHSEENLYQITEDNLEVLIERYKWILKKYKKLRKILLSNDVNSLMYYTKNYVFNEQLIKKHKKISSYYLRQSLIYFPSLLTVYYAIKNRFKSKQSFSVSIVDKPNNDRDYYE